jgi:hypothetical protein
VAAGFRKPSYSDLIDALVASADGVPVEELLTKEEGAE